MTDTALLSATMPPLPSKLRQDFKRSDFASLPLVRVVGRIKQVRVEHSIHEDRIDHVWLTLKSANESNLTVSINTRSLKNRNAGFDSRIRLGIIRGQWEALPEQGWEKCLRFDYFDLESRHNVFYEHQTRAQMEDFLLANGGDAMLAEVWGAPYWNSGPGIHQIHSRRASCAVATDIVGHDGAIRLYFEKDQQWLMVLLKFCGQP